MAEFRTGVPRREGNVGSMGTSATSILPAFDSFGEIEPYSKFIADRKNLNERYDNQVYEEKTGTVIKRWGYPGEQQFEQAVKAFSGSDEIDEITRRYYSTAGTGVPTEPITPDWECCDWLRINAPSRVASGSTSGISAGNKKGCVYSWSIEGCNPSYWGCGAITAAGTGGTGAGIHQTSKGVVFIAPTIPDKDTINCGRTVDTKIKVAILTADGQKQLAAEHGTAGWSGYGLGPGDELYDLFGPDNVCDDTATITTEADDCPGYCNGAEIGYTTQHMMVSTAQSLGVVNGNVNAEYTWMVSGGGYLTETKGPGTVYVAPVSNWNCEENALITLMCNGVIVDTLGIAVFSKESEHTKIGVTRYLFSIFRPVCQDYYGGCDGVGGLCGILWVSNLYYAYCNGAFGAVFGPEFRTWCRGQCNIPCSYPIPCSSTAPPCGDYCFDEVGWCGVEPYTYYDPLANGCCPDPPV